MDVWTVILILPIMVQVAIKRKRHGLRFYFAISLLIFFTTQFYFVTIHGKCTDFHGAL